jgi:hypothetical protein
MARLHSVFVIGQRWKNPLIVPGLIVAGVGLFYVSGTSTSRHGSAGMRARGKHTPLYP